MSDLLFTEIGSSGLKHGRGLIFEEDESKYRGEQYQREIDKLERQPTPGAAINLYTLFARLPRWSAERPDDTPEARRAEEFLASCMDDMRHPWAQTIDDAFTVAWRGYALLEEVYKRRLGRSPGADESGAPLPRSDHADGMIGWDKIQTRAQGSITRWEIDERGEILGAYQRPYGQVERFIPIEKLVHVRHRAPKGNPEGDGGIFRSAIADAEKLRFLKAIEGIGFERNLAGLPDMQVPLNVLFSDADADSVSALSEIKKWLAALRQDEYGYILRPSEVDSQNMPTGYKLQAFAGGGANPVAIHTPITRYEQRIAMVAHAQLLFLGLDKMGSHAMDSSKTDVLVKAIVSILETVRGAFNDTSVARIMRLNGFAREAWPEIVFSDIETRDLATIASYASTLIGAGAIVPDDRLDEYFREQARFPVADSMSARMPEIANGQDPQEGGGL